MGLLTTGKEQGSPRAETVGKRIALLRFLLGAGFLAVPRTLMRLALREPGPSDETVTVLRMLAGRELALALGALLAARRGPHALRGWVEGGMLADTVDAVAMAQARSFKPALRLLGSGSATIAAAVGARTARRL
ncbi:MAG: hypothetical protein ACRDYA_15130 [Egibacteraceae bacterium]